MTKELIKFLLLNIVLFIVLYIIFYFSGFLSGYGANSSSLKAEINLFKGFALAHLIINFLYTYIKQGKFTTINLLATFEILVLWLTTAWNIGYFSQ